MASFAIHGSLVQTATAGILVLGHPGSGKTTYALNLVAQGSRLVADDVVAIERRGDRLFGKSPPQFRRLFGYGGSVYSLSEGRSIYESVIDSFVDLSGGQDSALEFLGLSVPRTAGEEMSAELPKEFFHNDVTEILFAEHDARLGSALSI